LAYVVTMYAAVCWREVWADPERFSLVFGRRNDGSSHVRVKSTVLIKKWRKPAIFGNGIRVQFSHVP
jgi:hypothetical protein